MTRKYIASKVLSIGLVCLAIGAPSQSTAAEQTVDECSRELLLAYFPEPFVLETLKKFNIPEDKWSPIQKGLTSKDKDVIKIVEEKAAAMDPNPLKDPHSRQEAVKLFRETLLQVFSDVVKANGVSDDHQIQLMLDDVQQRKASRFAKCMQKQGEKAPVKSP